MFLNELTTEQTVAVLTVLLKLCQFGVRVSDTGFVQTDAPNVYSMLAGDCVYWE